MCKMHNISVVFKVNKSYHIRATLSTGIKFTIKVYYRNLCTHTDTDRETQTQTHTPSDSALAVNSPTLTILH